MRALPRLALLTCAPLLSFQAGFAGAEAAGAKGAYVAALPAAVKASEGFEYSNSLSNPVSALLAHSLE